MGRAAHYTIVASPSPPAIGHARRRDWMDCTRTICVYSAVNISVGRKLEERSDAQNFLHRASAPPLPLPHPFSLSSVVLGWNECDEPNAEGKIDES